jgi:hypothetical protein
MLCMVCVGCVVNVDRVVFVLTCCCVGVVGIVVLCVMMSVMGVGGGMIVFMGAVISAKSSGLYSSTGDGFPGWFGCAWASAGAVSSTTGAEPVTSKGMA